MIKETVQSKINEIFDDCDVDINLIDEFCNKRLERCINTIELIIKHSYAEQHKDKINNIKKIIDSKIATLLSSPQDDTYLFNDVDEEVLRSILKSSLNEGIEKLNEEEKFVSCPVCGESNVKEAISCSKCCFDELGKKISTQADEIIWLKDKLIPHGINYALSKMMPSESKTLRLILGLEDGIKHSDEEIAKMNDVCVNRISQIKAKFRRRLDQFPCTKRLQELQNR